MTVPRAAARHPASTRPAAARQRPDVAPPPPIAAEVPIAAREPSPAYESTVYEQAVVAEQLAIAALLEAPLPASAAAAVGGQPMPKWGYGALPIAVTGSGWLAGPAAVPLPSPGRAESGDPTDGDAPSPDAPARPDSPEYRAMPRSAAVDALDSQDFRRLRVRLREARPRVIRRAAQRRTRLLAATYLSERTPQTEAELVRWVTLAYRLLDPRNRDSQPERVLLAQLEAVPVVPRLWAYPQGYAAGDQLAPGDQPAHYASRGQHLPQGEAAQAGDHAPRRLAVAASIAPPAAPWRRLRQWARASWSRLRPQRSWQDADRYQVTLTRRGK